MTPVCVSFAFHPSQSEVQDLHHAARGFHDVFRLDVAMHDAHRVCRGERSRELGAGRDDLGHGQRTELEEGAKRLAGDVLACEVELIVDFLQGVDGGDAWMRQRGSGARFKPQSLASAERPIESRIEGLECNATRQSCVVREIDHAYSTPTQLSTDDVWADDEAFRSCLGIGSP